ncbi:P-loop containing nucleoside triphosphate hydrolase protein [Meredithblackwellia eburnea MCA 4105]
MTMAANGSRSSPKVTIICVAGPTCSGKTTLAKHLRQIIPNSVILHQDDFAPPAELVPYHPVHKVQDWDDPDGAILWDSQRSSLRHLRATGSLPPNHSSHDHLNEQVPVPIPQSLADEWRRKFEDLAVVDERGGEEKRKYIICDGFLMLYDAESVREFDVRIFVRESYEVLKQRREDRHGYHTAVQSDPEGALWRDPPNYWDNIVWPAFLKAHHHQFVSGNVEYGQPNREVIEGLEVMEASKMGMEEMVGRACEMVYKWVKDGNTVNKWKRP